MDFFRKLSVALALAALPTVFSAVFLGCKSNPIIGNVGYSVEPNIETLAVELSFAKDIKTDLGGSFPIKNYGTLEVTPSTPEQPFRIGFRLNLDVLNDNDYVRVNPVTTLPSGQRIPITGLNRGFARIKLDNKINRHFDVYVYVDVAESGKQWLGIAVLPDFMSSKYVPSGVVISKTFLKNKTGSPRAIAAAFGPQAATAAQLAMTGGFALFVNARALLDEASGSSAALATRARPYISDKGGAFVFSGLNAAYYNKNKKAQSSVNETFRTLFKENSFGRRMM